MDLSIVIVTWNNEKEIKPALRAVFAAAAGLAVETIVVDNASTDGTRAALADASFAGRIQMIANDKNLGFAAAVNEGLAKASGEYVLLLNPDTTVSPAAFKIMLDKLRAAPDVGIAGGKMLNDDGSWQASVRRFPTVIDQAFILLKLHNYFPGVVDKYFCNGFDRDQEQAVDQVRGAYFWISRKLIDRIGLLDARNFFIWFEEVDYCRRARDAGFKVLYFPDSVATHAGGASFGRALSLKKQFWFNRSLIKYFAKHGTALDVLALLLLTPFSFALAALVQILNLKPKKYV